MVVGVPRAKGRSVEPFAIASLWFVFACSIPWIAALRSGRESSAVW